MTDPLSLDRRRVVAPPAFAGFFPLPVTRAG